ncbi:MAG: hypothetical protein JXA07_04110 [Spirochaetes bacterium]|nr:hypothetical protein [Spirochaetota bacterium]
MSDYLKNVGRLEEKKRKKLDLEIKMKALVEQIHDKADPLDDISALDTEIIAADAMELARLHIEYKALIDDIRAVNKALGRES